MSNQTLGGVREVRPSVPKRRHRVVVAVLVLLSLLAASCSASEDTALSTTGIRAAVAPEDQAPETPPLARSVAEAAEIDAREEVSIAVNEEAFGDAPSVLDGQAVELSADDLNEIEIQDEQEDAPISAVTTWVATATSQVTQLVAYDRPNGSVIPFEFIVPNPHQFGGPQVLMVVNGNPSDQWVEVQLPIRPNGQTGWVETRLYTFAETQVRAEVDLSERSIVVYDGTTVIAQTRAVIGSSTTPTPLGTFFITAKRRNPPEESYIGPWALALSAFSEVYDTFGGGLPVIAIHGTNRPDQVGDARSNGCLRIPNDVVTLLAEFVPLGAPVIINA